MSVNGVTSTQTNYDTTTYSKASEKTNTASGNDRKTSGTSFTDEAAVYETSSASAKQKSNAAIVAQMKQDTANRTAQLQSLVQNMFLKQGQTFASAGDMIKALANGELKVDAATAKQAQEDISEDGYWGVKQTSDRIFDFAMALSGGDEDKMEEMLAAFEKGYKQATGAWGKELPGICKDTYDAVQEKFDKYFNGDDTKTEA